MKTKLFVQFLAVFAVCFTVLAQESTPAQPTVVEDASTPGPADKIHSFYQVTSGVCLQDSGGQTQRVFVNADVFVGHLNIDKYRLMLSSSPDANAPYIVDDGIFISGKKLLGMSYWSNPYGHLGEDPSACYKGAPAADVTGCLRQDGHVFVQCMDLGGGVFGCSALYLRVVPKEKSRSEGE